MANPTIYEGYLRSLSGTNVIGTKLKSAKLYALTVWEMSSSHLVCISVGLRKLLPLVLLELDLSELAGAPAVS